MLLSVESSPATAAAVAGGFRRPGGVPPGLGSIHPGYDGSVALFVEGARRHIRSARITVASTTINPRPMAGVAGTIRGVLFKAV